MKNRKMINCSMLFVCFWMSANLCFGQNGADTTVVKTTSFDCYGKKVSVDLPSDFRGPYLFPYEEGLITEYMFGSGIMLGILCGADSDLSPDSTYFISDSVVVNNHANSYWYYSKVKNLYARKDIFGGKIVMCQDVPFVRKKEFDAVFEYLSTGN